MSEVIELDPVAVSDATRELLDITSWVKVDGVDWGQGEIQQYIADMAVGSSPVDFRIPNRIVNIPLVLKDLPLTTFTDVRSALQRKVGLFQREGGWLRRRVGSTDLYADVVNASLHLGGSWLAAYRNIDVDAVLQLECLPEFYGDEVTLDTVNATNLLTNPSFESGTGSWTAVNATLAQVSTPVVAGGFSLRVTSASTAYSVRQNVAVTAGLPYTLSVYVNASNFARALNGAVIVWKDGGGSTVSTVNLAGSPVTVLGAYTRYSVSATAPVGAVTADVYALDVGSAGVSGDIHFVDAVQFTQTSGVVPYADGVSRATVLYQGGVQAVIAGDHPGRCRLVLSDTSGNSQRGLIWGLRSSHYDSASTAALFYEAEAMTGLNGAASATRSGASGGHTMKLTSIPATDDGLWVPMLLTDVSSVQLTHQGSYRVWSRVWATDPGTSVRLAWGSGSLASPVENDPASVPGTGAFYLLDLGTVRLDATPVAAGSWQGVVQVQDPNGAGTFEIDTVFLQPLDESAGQESAITPSSATVVNQNAGFVPTDGTTFSDDSSAGTRTWTATDGSTVAGTNQPQAIFTAAGQLSHYLNTETYGFSIPAGATVLGIEVYFERHASVNHKISANVVQLLKAGARVGANRAAGVAWTVGIATTVLGGPTDLWGTTWTPAQINAAGFGVAIQAAASGAATAYLYNSPEIVVYYQLAAGFTVSQDVVITASGSCEIRTEGAFRTDTGTGKWGKISQATGDLPRIPPSGLESRNVELLVRPTRGNLDNEADSALDGLSVVVKYRPSYLFHDT